MNISVVGGEGLTKRRWVVAIVGLVLAMGFAWLPFSDWIHEFAGTAHLIGNEAIWWAWVVVILWYVRKIEHRPLSSIGLRKPGLGNIAIGVAAGIAILAITGAMYYVLLPLLHLNDEIANTSNFHALVATPIWWRLISCIRGAVAEEVMFRGYAMERIEELSSSRTAAVLISGAVFTLAHVGSWGWSHVLTVAAGALALSLLYLWRRNLWVNIIAHFIVDAVATLA